MVRKPSLLLVLTLALVAAVPAAAAPPKVSEFGKYSGYSEAVYDGWVRSSQYVPMRDGTRLAVDIVRPTLHGKVATERLPVVWTHTRYQRAFFDLDGITVYSMVDTEDWLRKVVRHGYVVAAVDARATGAPFGTYMASWRSTSTRPHGCSRPATASASRSPGPTGRTPAHRSSPRRRLSRCGASRGGGRGWTCR